MQKMVSFKTALRRIALVRSALVRFVLVRFAPVRFALYRFAPFRFAPVRFALVRFVRVRFAPVRFAPDKSEFIRRACDKSTPCKSASANGEIEIPCVSNELFDSPTDARSQPTQLRFL